MGFFSIYFACHTGGVGHRDEGFVEYDMDEADWRWLNKFNLGQDRLPARRFELLIWRLELVNAEANDQQSLMSGKEYSFLHHHYQFFLASLLLTLLLNRYLEQESRFDPKYLKTYTSSVMNWCRCRLS